MNILFIVSSLAYGGAERVCSSVANGLYHLGHKVCIMTRKVTQDDYYVDNNIQVFECALIGNYLSRRFYYIKQLSSLLKKQKIEVVVSINGDWLTYTALICKFYGVKIVYSDHNSFERPSSDPLSLKVKLRKFYESRLCDLTTVLTDRDKTILKNRSNVVVMPNPLFLSVLEMIPPKKKTILAVGRQDAWYVKGFDVLIKSWGCICKEFPEWGLKIIGTGSPYAISILKNIIEENKVERVELIQFCNTINKEYESAEIFVLSSRYEGFGLVLTEAMSQRCACIACDYMTRQSEIVTNGIDGLVCKPDSVNDLTLSIKNLIKDDDLRYSLQLHSSDNLDRYSEKNIAMQWNCILLNLLKK